MNNVKTKKILDVVFYSIIIVAITLLIGDMISAKLVGGARWSSGLPLGGVDNWLYEGGSLYTVPEKGFTPGSSYFPGIVLLSLLYRVLFGYGAETAIIITGGIIAFLSCWGFARIVTDGKKRVALLTLVSLVLFRKMFLAPTYLLEMHPDIPALMCMTWGIIALHKYVSKKNIIQYIFATLCFVGAGLFKQNAVAMYAGLGLFTLFTHELDIKTKIKVLLSEFIAGVCVLFVVFSIDGCWYNCVSVNASHPLLSLKEYLAFGLSTIKHNKLFLGLVGLYCLQSLITPSTKELLGKMYMLAALFGTIFCMFGAAKYGANEGNMEAAIIALMPCVLSLFNKMISYVKDNAIIDSFIDKMNFQNNRKIRLSIATVIIFGACFIWICKGVCRVHGNLQKYHERIELQKAFSRWISTYYHELNVAYNTESYEILNAASINKKTDLKTVEIWDMGSLISDEQLHLISQKEQWNIILTIDTHDEARWPVTFSEFNQLERGLYPDVDVKVYTKKSSPLQ